MVRRIDSITQGYVIKSGEISHHNEVVTLIDPIVQQEPVDPVQEGGEAALPSSWHGQTITDLDWHLYQGDALLRLQEQPASSYDCVVTSPPYYWLRDYKVANQIGLEDSVAGYVDAVARIMDEVKRVLVPSGVLFLNIGDTYYSAKGESQGTDRKNSKRRFGLRAVDKSGGLGIGIRPKTAIGIPWRVAIEMCSRGWILRSPIVWHRQHALPESVRDRPRRTYEYVFMFVKSRRYYFNRKALLDTGQDDMWTIAARPEYTNGLDTAPFPDELVRRCVDIGCPPGGKVLDPFVGSGTSMRVALRLGRSVTGIELNPEFCQFVLNQLATF